MKLDFRRTLEVLKNDFIKVKTDNDNTYFKGAGDETHYLSVSTNHMMVVLDLGNNMSFTAALWPTHNKMCITLGSDSDVFSDEETQAYDMTEIYHSEEHYFQSLLIREIKAPYEIYAGVLRIIKEFS